MSKVRVSCGSAVRGAVLTPHCWSAFSVGVFNSADSADSVSWPGHDKYRTAVCNLNVCTQLLAEVRQTMVQCVAQRSVV